MHCRYLNFWGRGTNRWTHQLPYMIDADNCRVYTAECNNADVLTDDVTCLQKSKLKSILSENLLVSGTFVSLLAPKTVR